MAKAVAHSAKMLVAMFFLFALVLSMNEKEEVVVEADLCGKLSKTWSGYCAITSHCDRQCKDWEGAAHGACHDRFPGKACYCYFNC